MKNIGYNNSFKRAILLLCSVLLPGILPAQEHLTFVAVKDTVAFSAESGRGASVAIQAGDIIATNAEIFYGRRSTASTSDEHHLQIWFGEPNNKYMVFVRYFKPVNTEGFFGEDIFIDYPVDIQIRHPISTLGWTIAVGDVDEMWVPAYYKDILLGQDRNKLLELFPVLANLMEQDAFDGRVFRWYNFDTANIRRGRAMFFNSAIQLGVDTHLAVRNIRRTNFGYVVECVVSTLDWRVEDFTPAAVGIAFWNAHNPGDEVTLLLNLDGDYLDIYTYGSIIHVGTFIRVGREFIAQYQSLIRTNTADLTNVMWPRRAEGRTGFTPPAGWPSHTATDTTPDGATLAFRAATHRTTARLHVRESPTTAANIVTTLDLDAEVQVLETGSLETIGGVTATWVRVRAANGYTGWSFAGFLEVIQLAVPVIEPVEAPTVAIEQPVAVAQDDTATGSMPPWVLLAIIGGVVAAVGGALFVVRRRKA